MGEIAFPSPALIGAIAALSLLAYFIGYQLYKLYVQARVSEWPGEPVGYWNILLITPDGQATPIEGPAFRLALDWESLEDYVLDRLIALESSRLDVLESSGASPNEIKEIKERLELLLSSHRHIPPIHVYGIGMKKGEKYVLISYGHDPNTPDYKLVNPNVRIIYPYQLGQVWLIGYTLGKETISFKFYEEGGKFLLGLGKSEEINEEEYPAFFFSPISLRHLQVFEIPEDVRSSLLKFVSWTKEFTDFHEVWHRLQLTEEMLENERRQHEDTRKVLIDLSNKLQYAQKYIARHGWPTSIGNLLLPLFTYVLLPTVASAFIGAILSNKLPPFATWLLTFTGLCFGLILAARRISSMGEVAAEE